MERRQLLAIEGSSTLTQEVAMTTNQEPGEDPGRRSPLWVFIGPDARTLQRPAKIHEMAETAQAAFARLLRDLVSPALRAEGLRGSGNSYVLPDDKWWAQLAFQKSKYSNRDVVKFKVTLGAVRKADWDAIRREHSYVKDTPPPGLSQMERDAERLAQSYYPKKPASGGIMSLGHLIPDVRADHWWSIGATEPERMMAAVLEAVKQYGIPALQNRIRTGVWDDALSDALRSL
jgi:hypothetical protein